jgi:hypothetical protein
VLLVPFALACLCQPPPAVSPDGRKPATRPAEQPPHAEAAGVPPPAEKTGCTVLQVQVTPAAGIAVQPIPGSSCGVVQPTLAGGATFDPTDRIARLPIALANGGIVQVHAPAALIARTGSLQIPGRPVGVGGLHFVATDAAPGDSTGSGVGVQRWSYDRLLQRPGTPSTIASDGEVVLPGGTTSATRTIAVAVPPGVTSFRLTLTAIGTNVLTVPAEAPDRVPADELEDSWSSANVLSGDPRFGGRVVRNKLWLLFRQEATIEQRQAALDAVQGLVVGGKVIGRDHYYYVRIPAFPDSGGAPLARALRALAPLPQVQHVMPDAVGESAPVR